MSGGGSDCRGLSVLRSGDGIMSAIGFDMALERVANPKGDRVKHDERQIPALQILRRQRQRAGIRFKEG
jgi:hypothetical protein